MFKNVSSFLGKFTNLTPPERFIKDSFIIIAAEMTGITLKKEEIDVRGDTLYIKLHSVAKNELFLQKDALLQRLNQELQQYKKVIKDIR